MELWQALILGLVEGLTEFLPVSSTGHLVVTQRLLGIGPSEAANAYAVAIQAGAIAAVLGLYRKRVSQMCLGLIGKDPDGSRILIALLIAFVPAAVLGVTLDAKIEQYLFGPWPVVAAWATGGLLLLVLGPQLESVREGLAVEAVGPRIAIFIGIAQCAALWPGVSRSLATIMGGLAAGLSIIAAVEFSFLLGLITLAAATAYKCLGSGRVMLDTYGWAAIVIGFGAAWLSAALSVRWMLSWLGRRGFGIFAVWRIAVAAIVAALLLGKVIEY
jgi:undecaprenyl-diphosphatase